jgi:mannose-6-phosphate isomerase-like protein (cupin superfamily)
MHGTVDVPSDARAADTLLLESVQEFVTKHPAPEVNRFAWSMRNCGQPWCRGGDTQLPARRFLEHASVSVSASTQAVLRAFRAQSGRLSWEQTYTAADNVVGADMLAGYAFAEIVGERGSFLSDQVRCGVGVWGPHINYPAHRHEAEEIYVVLAGSARFQLGEKQVSVASVDDVVFVPSNEVHSLRTTDEALVVLYFWQGGALRQKSVFE